MIDKIRASIKFYDIVSDILHYIVGLLLIAISGILLYHTFKNLGVLISSNNIIKATIRVVDKALFVIMILEIAHTVLISFKEHVLQAEPFLVVGIIASVRRILILSFNIMDIHGDKDIFIRSVIETGVLGLFILALVVSIYLLRKADSSNPGSDYA